MVGIRSKLSRKHSRRQPSLAQSARSTIYYPFQKHYKSQFPASNVDRCNETVATGVIYSDVPAVDDGSTCAQIYVGLKSMATDVPQGKSDKAFTKTLDDNIRKQGYTDKLVSDRAQS